MATEEDSDVGRKESKSRMLMIVVGVVVVGLLCGGGAAAYFKFLNTPQARAEDQSDQNPVSYAMPTFLVNLADPGSKRFLKVTMDLELTSKATADECKAMDPQMRDLILTILSSQESSDIVSADDKVRLKKQLIRSVNHILTKGKVLEIYFTDFLIQ